jgi:hypothetical protein
MDSAPIVARNGELASSCGRPAPEYSDSIGSDRDESYEKTTFGAQYLLA